MNIPFVDLAEQQRRIRSDLDQRIAKVLDHGGYILGPEVSELEAELAGEVGELEVNSTRLDTEAIKPYKKDIDVKSVSLVWLPYDWNNKPVW